jgi:glycolate dehydrogenase FAD-linked subunit
LIEALRAIVGDDWVVSDEAGLASYACDGLTGYRVRPLAVALPATTDEVAACVRAAADAGVPFVARGAGTGLSGGSLPVADGIVIGLARMREILAVDVANERVTVQPGVANLDVSKAVAPLGYLYAPDPSSQQVCTIGGNVAENSGGAHCLKYGFTTNHVLAVTFVTADGRVTRLGSAAADAPGLDLLGAVVGSEGTLGIVTEITLRILPVPEAVETLLAAFDSTDAAGEAVSRIIAAGVVPAAIEMMDRLTIEAAEKAVHAGYPECEAALLVELDGPRPEVDALYPQIAELCRGAGAGEVRRAESPADRARMWKGRKAAFAAMGRVSPDYYVQDGVIPRTRLPEVLRGIRALEQRYGLRVGNVFHAGDGNLHPLVLYDGAVEGASERALALAGEILALCLAAGGSITGEHGVGHDKVCQMPKMFSGADLTVMDAVRAAFDPQRRSNPGKLVPTPRLCGEVPGFYRAHPLERAGLAERF